MVIGLSNMNSYHVLELVGEGSYGRVYKGRKKFTGQVVALKFIPKVGRTDKELHNLKREIEIMRGLKHPNIVQMFDSFETEREVVVVTEYAEGDLFHILEDDGNLPENQVREIACQLVSALYYLHSHRILHRDMKPQNILLGKGGVVKLCDFGFARAMSVSTLVLTSIKGTPLYMSPELVEEKPYDHTADLWSLGCILYELHTGTPPFYTNSIFHLVQLIVRDAVKWPDTMSQNCTSFLKGLLTKDPQNRLSWPELLHHPFVVDGVLVLSDCSAFSPLTVTPSPDVQALKLQQVAEKTAPLSGESRLLRKAREQRDNVKKSKPLQTGNTRATSVPTRTLSAASKPLTNNIPPTGTSSQLDVNTVQIPASLGLKSKNKANETSQEKGQISTDYEREFPSVEVGPQLLRRAMEDGLTTMHKKDSDSELEWENLVEYTDPSHQAEMPNLQIIIPLLKNKFNTAKNQLKDGVLEGASQIHQPLKILHNLLLTSDAESSYLIGCEIGLPQLLFDLVYIAVEKPVFVEQPWSVTVLGEMMVVLLTYWERHCDWVETEKRLEEFNQPFIKILNRPKPNPLLPLAASVLSMFTHHGVSVDIAMDNLIALVQDVLCDSHKQPQLSLPPGWGQCDGLLSLVLHALSEQENGPLAASIDSEILFNMWCRIGSSSEETSFNTEFCSANGLYVFLSAMLYVFTKDPQSCVPLFSDSASKCTYMLSHLLDADWIRKLSKGTPGTLWEDLSPSSFTVLGCHLLCFPFALDLPSKTMARILQSYDSCGIVTGLLQVIQTFPVALLELPLRLMGRLLLCDPGRSVPCLSAAAEASGFFSPSMANQAIASRGQTAPPSRTASSLLSALLEADVLWDCAVELLNLLSQVARCSPRPACLQVHLESAGLQQALSHCREQIRAATCSLLGNINPFMPTTVKDTPPTLQPEMFKAMIDLLQDPCVPVRRMACRAVGNWLGLIGQVGFKPGRAANGKGSGATGWRKGNDEGKNLPTRTGSGRVLSSRLKQGTDGEDTESRWMEEASRTTARLTPLITDHNVLTRRHCCSALANLLNVHGGVSLLLKEDVPSLLLTAACTDDHHAVRQAAVATLCMYSREDAIRQVLMTLGAHQSLLQASHHAALPPDYGQLIALL